MPTAGGLDLQPGGAKYWMPRYNPFALFSMFALGALAADKAIVPAAPRRIHRELRQVEPVAQSREPDDDEPEHASRPAPRQLAQRKQPEKAKRQQGIGSDFKADRPERAIHLDRKEGEPMPVGHHHGAGNKAQDQLAIEGRPEDQD